MDQINNRQIGNSCSQNSGYGNYNYSGYGSIADDFGDFEVKSKNKQKPKVDIYSELLSQLRIDHNTMMLILNRIIKSTDVTYVYVYISNDFNILYFKDNFGHITPVSLKKIVEARNMLLK